MKVKEVLLLVMAATLFSATQPRGAMADDIIVEQNPTSGHFATIQDALTQAKAITKANPNKTNQIFVSPGLYSGTITVTPDSGVIAIIGGTSVTNTNTANTLLSGSETVVSLSNVNGLTIRNFTFENGASLSISNNSTAIVKNIIFNTTKTAIAVTGSTGTQIINNTFYRCTTAAISTDAELTAITNNIFSNNGTAISAPSPQTHPTYNDFYPNTNTGIVDNNSQHSIPNTDHSDSNPLFVSAGSDFHLQSNSPAKGTGNPTYSNPDGTASDMGAYGGPTADVPPPAAVTGVTATLSDSTITVNWTPISNGTVKGYRVYYGTFSAADPNFPGKYNGVGSPRLITGAGAASTTFPKPQPVTSLDPTVITSLEPQDRAIVVHWTPVTGATKYLVYHNTNSISDSDIATLKPDEVSGTKTFATIGSLQNLTPYYFKVVAQADNDLFVAVTAVVDTSADANAGSSNESSYSEAPSPVFIGDTAGPIKSIASNEEHDFSEAASAFPNVKKGGCFIATAAYGFYSAPQVQALRLFRDRFLMTNPLGRAFVAWYYHYGPIGARFITEHQWLKPPVRLLLLPLVLMAMFLVYLPPALQVAILMSAVVLAAFLYQRSQQRRLLVQPGGMR